MAGKGKKKRNSRDSTASNGSDEKKKQAGGKQSRKKIGSAKATKFQGDIFSEGAMENAYCVCHNVQVFVVEFVFAFESIYFMCVFHYVGCLESSRFPVARCSQKEEEGQEEVIDD